VAAPEAVFISPTGQKSLSELPPAVVDELFTSVVDQIGAEAAHERIIELATEAQTDIAPTVIKKMLADKGITHQEAADYVGVSLSDINRLMALIDNIHPKAHVVEKLLTMSKLEITEEKR